MSYANKWNNSNNNSLHTFWINFICCCAFSCSYYFKVFSNVRHFYCNKKDRSIQRYQIIEKKCFMIWMKNLKKNLKKNFTVFDLITQVIIILIILLLILLISHPHPLQKKISQLFNCLNYIYSLFCWFSHMSIIFYCYTLNLTIR